MLIHANTDGDNDNPRVHSRSTLGDFPTCHESEGDVDELDWIEAHNAEVNCADCIDEPHRDGYEDKVKVHRAAVAYATFTMGKNSEDVTAASWFNTIKLIVDARKTADLTGSAPTVRSIKMTNTALSLAGIHNLAQYADLFAAVFDHTRERAPKTPSDSGVNVRPKYVFLAWKLGEAWKMAESRGVAPADWTFPRNVDQARLIETGTVIENPHFAKRPDADDIRDALAHLPREDRYRGLQV